MTDETDDQAPTIVELTSLVVANFVANNEVAAAELPGLIRAVHTALAGVSTAPAPAMEARKPPAVPIKKSVTADYLVSLEDGRQFKSLRRHLTALGITPDAYRAKWGLPASYPMVAANYAASRSALAKEMGLGSRGRPATLQESPSGQLSTAPDLAPTTVSQPQLEVAVKPLRRGRPKGTPIKPEDETFN